MPTQSPLPLSIYLPAQKPGKDYAHRRKYLVYFLPGNPGVVAFYQKFLEHLRAALDEQNDGECDVEIFGTSLAGFECDATGSRKSQELPTNIDGQIRFAETTLSNHIEQSVSSRDTKQEQAVRVILVGHSLGAFLVMEMMQRYRDQLQARGETQRTYGLVSVIGLFPGLVHLAQGTMPAKLAWLDSVPYGASLISTAIRFVVNLIPLFLLQRIIAQGTGYPVEDVDTTCRWLRSRWGLHETLHLAKEEMIRIADDRWDNEVWGSPRPTPLSQPRPKMFFLFGEHDDWIPSGPRDELIRARGRSGRSTENEWRATMEVDRTGIPHDFAVKHSKPVAETVLNWIREVSVQDSGS